MTVTLLPSAQEVADAMATTFERDALTGSQSRWCPERDASTIRRWIIDRSRELGGGIRRVVRFARLATMAGGGDYIRFLYDARIPSLRAAHFKAVLQEAQASGRLPQALATLSPSGVVLHEPSMRLAGEAHTAGFGIDFAQMPRLAALLDILHNALGYGVVADLLEPILARGTPRLHADEVARTLHARLNAWLSDRLDSPHYIRQAQTMRAFLAKRGALAPEAIDDEAILSFWTFVVAADATDVEGFRLFTSAARGMLRYRRSLRDYAVYGAICAPLSLDDKLDRQVPEAAPGYLGGIRDAWRSPLRGLATPPANTVKWLTKRERLKLLNYLGGSHPDGEDERDEAEEPRGASSDRGLAGDERLELCFLRTLLRADVFGAAQAGIVARLRKGALPAAAVAEAMVLATDQAYEACAASYAAVRDQLRLEALAALSALLEQGALEALVLVGHLSGQDVVRALLTLAGVEASARQGGPGDTDPPDLDDGQRRAIASAVQSFGHGNGHAGDSAASDLIAAARAAARKVHRTGFRPEDRTDPAIFGALRAAVPAVVDVLAELDRLVAALPQAARRETMLADRPRFAETFQRTYCAAAASS